MSHEDVNCNNMLKNNNKEQGLSVFGIPTEQDGGHLRKLHAAAHSVMELRFFMFTHSDEK